jgi:hypothetical protein
MSSGLDSYGTVYEYKAILGAEKCSQSFWFSGAPQENRMCKDATFVLLKGGLLCVKN